MRKYGPEISLEDDVNRIKMNSIPTFQKAQHREIVKGFVKFQNITMEMQALLDYRFLVVTFSIGSKEYIGQIDIQCGEFRKLFSLKSIGYLKQKIFGRDGSMTINQRINDLVYVIDNDHGQEHIMRTSKLCRFLLDPQAKGEQLTGDLNLKGYFVGLKIVHSYTGGWVFQTKDTELPVSFETVLNNCINGVKNNYSSPKVEDVSFKTNASIDEPQRKKRINSNIRLPEKEPRLELEIGVG